MTNKPKKMANLTANLEHEINAKIAESVIATMPTDQIAHTIKTRLMQRVKQNSQLFIFANQGEWKSISDGVTLKLLHKTSDATSFLVKIAANAEIAPHEHRHNEESFVIEGEVWLEGVLCKAGDYHYAVAGSAHQQIRTTTGCTLLIKTY